MRATATTARFSSEPATREDFERALAALSKWQVRLGVLQLEAAVTRKALEMNLAKTGAIILPSSAGKVETLDQLFSALEQ